MQPKHDVLTPRGIPYDPDQELRKWAIERSMDVGWVNHTESVTKFAKTLFDFVKGEEDGK